MKYKLALVHDYLTYPGGAERTLKGISEIWPEAPIYTLLYDPENLGKLFLKNKIEVSFLEKFPKFFKKKRKYLLPFLATAPETFDLRNYDVVFSSSGAFSKAVITKPQTLSICYCHSPMRFAWDYTHKYLQELSFGRIRNLSARLILNYIRLWDVASSDRVDYYIANSQATRQKINKYYRKDSKVIYPPVAMIDLSRRGKWELSSLKKNEKDGYYLIVSRLTPSKKIDIAVEAFNKLNWKLVVIGNGSELKKLQKMAGPSVNILGHQSRAKTVKYYRNCSGYIQVVEEDFGISMVEAMACGKPVLALRSGGALEIIEEDKTGEFFDYPMVEILAEGVYRLNQSLKEYNPEYIKSSVEKFSKERFQAEIKYFVEEKLSDSRSSYAQSS